MNKFSKVEKWDAERILVMYDPQEVEGPDGETRVEYAHRVIVPEVKKGAIVEALMREQFSVSDEIAILRQRNTKKAEFNAYNEAAEAAKALADQILAALND